MLIADADESIQASSAVERSGRLADLVRLIRPHHWSKNVFVFAPLIFSQVWNDPDAFIATLVAVACFCLWSSAVYCLNDSMDASADRKHPRKKDRPVASGRVSTTAAVALSIGLVAAGVTLSTVFLPVGFLVIGGLYLVNNLAYCTFLKHRVIVDVLSIAIGFVLRLEGGCVAIGVAASSWILVCGFSLALVLGFGKRRLEIGILDEPRDFRPVLKGYDAEKLNILLGITASVCLLAYMLYVVAPETQRLHQTEKLVYTVPFVAYGLFRFVFKTHEAQHDGPVEVLLRDYSFAINGVLWGAVTVIILYLK